MSNIDFISEKWRSIRRTRRLAYIHTISSIVPLIYVAVYAEAQRQAQDEKELGAALAALMFNMFQLLRTVMGKVQVDAFSEWCKHAAECIRALRGDDEGSDDEVEDVEERVRVNNTVVDNELGGRDVTVLPSWKRVWNGMKEGEFAPHKWLVTDQAKLSTVRWSGAYLCGMGEDWGAQIARHSMNNLATFFSHDMRRTREFLQKVTWNIEENDGIETISVSTLGDEDIRTNLSGEMETAYGGEIYGFDLEDPKTVDSYSFEFDSLVGSYPADDSSSSIQNREWVSLGLVHSLLLAKHLGVEKLKSIRRYYEYYCPPFAVFCHEALQTFLKQTTDAALHESEVLKTFYDENDLPMFPYRMQMIALWEQDTNWRVLQASAHCDIDASMCIHAYLQLESKPEAVNLFDYWSNIAQGALERHPGPWFLGAVVETVRTFLAQWVTASAQEANWEPAIPDECFEFDLSKNVCDVEIGYAGISDPTLIWVCQLALQKKVSRTWSEHSNLPSSHVLIMLFLLGFPHLELEYDYDNQVVSRESDGNLTGQSAEGSSTVGSRAERTVNVSIKTYRVYSRTSPQDISVVISVDFESWKVTLQLKNESESSQFIWQDWVDTAMGIMKGLGQGTMNNDRRIRQADLRRPLVRMSPLPDENLRESGERIGIAHVWMGWPPFDTRICKFEIDQWFNAYNINMNHGESMNMPIHYEVWKQAKQMLETISISDTHETTAA